VEAAEAGTDVGRPGGGAYRGGGGQAGQASGVAKWEDEVVEGGWLGPEEVAVGHSG
jgi:hypothetical protein